MRMEQLLSRSLGGRSSVCPNSLIPTPTVLTPRLSEILLSESPEHTGGHGEAFVSVARHSVSPTHSPIGPFTALASGSDGRSTRVRFTVNSRSKRGEWMRSFQRSTFHLPDPEKLPIRSKGVTWTVCINVSSYESEIAHLPNSVACFTKRNGPACYKRGRPCWCKRPARVSDGSGEVGQ